MKRIAVLLLLLGCFSRELAAQGQIFLVRHADKSESGTDARDPELSPAGRTRAESLARVLRNAGITSVYATEYKRTQQTAEPLARAAGIELTIVRSQETDSLLPRLRELTGNALVVGHSNTVPEIIKQLGIEAPIAIAETDYDNLFIVVLGEQPRLIQLHY